MASQANPGADFLISTQHSVRVSGHRIEFQYTCDSDGGKTCTVAGVVPFAVENLDDARDIIRSLFSSAVP